MDFYATWCGPCRTIAPHMDNLARVYTNVVFVKVDVDKLQVWALELSVHMHVGPVVCRVCVCWFNGNMRT